MFAEPRPHAAPCPQVIQAALQDFREEVESREFPGAAFSPYRIADGERAALAAAAREAGLDKAAAALEGGADGSGGGGGGG